jgi:hypothetical protein
MWVLCTRMSISIWPLHAGEDDWQQDARGFSSFVTCSLKDDLTTPAKSAAIAGILLLGRVLVQMNPSFGTIQHVLVLSKCACACISQG